MASTPQHRCVFVGNIPYDASEEQLIQICEEVGPVVSFRLVMDRETGKPKGYGFCEYKDEETALSARRNLQGFEINGRQLRVDFAENDKGADRNREQGRGGPGMAVNIAEQKQIRAVVSPGDLTDLQPIGLPLAMTAASAVAVAIGGAQVGYQFNKKGLQNRPAVGDDPLTLHLSTLSRNQLTQVISEMRALVIQNKELARQLLLVHPQLSKAILQAHMMLGTITPQKLQMPNIRQSRVQFSQPSWQSDQLGQQLAALNPLGLPLFVTPLSSVPQSSLVHNPFSASLQNAGQPISQLTNLTHVGTLQQTTVPGQPGVAADPSIHPQSSSGIPARPTPVPGSSTALRPVLQHPSQSGQGRSAQYNFPAISSIQPFHVSRPMSPDHGEQVGSLVTPFINPKHKETAMPSQVTRDGPWINGRTVNTNVLQGSADRNSAGQQTIHPSKRVKLESGTDVCSSTPELTASAAIGSSPEAHNLEKHAPQVQLPPEMESALLQQVMNLTPEQLSSLSPEQRQQVLQLQQMLR